MKNGWMALLVLGLILAFGLKGTDAGGSEAEINYAELFNDVTKAPGDTLTAKIKWIYKGPAADLKLVLSAAGADGNTPIHVAAAGTARAQGGDAGDAVSLTVPDPGDGPYTATVQVLKGTTVLAAKEVGQVVIATPSAPRSSAVITAVTLSQAEAAMRGLFG